MHRMTSRERVLAVLSGQQPDHRPYMPITMMFAADVLGVKYLHSILDHKTMADAQIKTAEMFGLIMFPPSPQLQRLLTWAPGSSGSTISRRESSSRKRCSPTNPTLTRLPSPDSVFGASMEDRIRGVELLRQRVGNDLIVEGWVEGPCSDAADFRGMNRLMVDFSDDPEFVAQLFEYSVELATGFAAAQIAAGADIIGIGDPPSSLVGPADVPGTNLAVA